jgi:transposase
MKFLKENKIETVSWPAKSPDLNIIENVWGWMVKDIYGTLAGLHTKIS